MFGARPRWTDTPFPGVFRERVDQLLGFRHDPNLRRQEEVRGRPCGGYQLRRRPSTVTDKVPSPPSGELLSSSASSPSARPEAGMSPFRNPGSPGEFEPTDSSTPGSALGTHSPQDIFQDSVEEASLLPDGLSSLSMDAAPGDQYGPVYDGELTMVS